jgi:hypothetical protein
MPGPPGRNAIPAASRRQLAKALRDRRSSHAQIEDPLIVVVPSYSLAFAMAVG